MCYVYICSGVNVYLVFALGDNLELILNCVILNIFAFYNNVSYQLQRDTSHRDAFHILYENVSFNIRARETTTYGTNVACRMTSFDLN